MARLTNPAHDDGFHSGYKNAGTTPPMDYDYHQYLVWVMDKLVEGREELSGWTRGVIAHDLGMIDE